MADIFVCSFDNKKVLKMPWLPEQFPNFSRSPKNEVFETFDNGDYTLIGQCGPLEFSLEGKLPINPAKFPFSKSDIKAYEIINLISSHMLNKKPIRLIINRNENEVLPTNLVNVLVSVEGLEWQELKGGFVAYSGSFKEYKNV